MAQARVTEFFATRKKRRAEQPSKRRKVDFTETAPALSFENTGPVKLSNTDVNDGYRNVEDTVEIPAKGKQQQHVLKPVQTVRATRSSTKSTRSSSTNAKQKSNTNTRQSTRSQKSDIPNIFQNFARKLSPADGLVSDVKVTPTESKAANKVFSEVTDCWDDHDGCSSNTEESACATPKTSHAKEKNGRKRKKDQKLTDVQQLLSTPSQEICLQEKSLEKKGHASVKKKLVMPMKEKVNVQESKTDASPAPEQPLDENVDEGSSDAVLRLASTMSPPKAISPLPLTPQQGRSTRSKNAPAKPTSEKILAAIEQCKALTKDSSSKEAPLIDPTVVKARLAKCGKLEELKAQLAKMNSAKAKLKPKKVKEPEVAKADSPKLKPFDSLDIEVEKTKEAEGKKVPAYERFHHLATSEAPALSLPYKYRVLAEMFRGMDTVVSMLHNRSEIITFSKLKVAVQAMNKRNFELKHAGQIKTVFPHGYIYRQEKGLPCYGGKTSGYQLTVEPNFHFNTNSGDDEMVKAAKVTFTPSHLLQRRGFFHNRLIAIVKRYHREFLSKLSKPLAIPDEKITRWHPQFKLDEVPDMDISPLPEAPFEKKYHTAKDVLEATRGKILPQVERALENVAARSESNILQSSESSSKLPASKPAVKGVPQSLLEKIRAKEAAKLQAALTRNPAEEKRTLMMSRLPDMMRIVRNYYVTEKKNTLPMEIVIQKLQDSYRSTIALSDVEAHVKLMVELTPDWLSLQQVRKGRYLKLNTGLELLNQQDKIRALVKARK
ncbi:DNA replication factor Cdt1-like [Liolophura sinensis]|uniref:DNA replication factor Cdt1-like n=1 Tax=Liolophura sinensis TaxID=3198878 RepID=UPI0031590503